MNPTGKENKCQDCKVLHDHVSRLDAWVAKWSDLTAKIPVLCKAIEEIKEWIATWPPSHMEYARGEIEKDEAWKRQMEKELQLSKEEIKKEIGSVERKTNERFDSFQKWGIIGLCSLAMTLATGLGSVVMLYIQSKG